MIILKECSACLSNYEVLSTLKNLKIKRTNNKNLSTITAQTIEYLEENPCKKQSPEAITNFLKSVEEFKLTKLEKLTLLNLCPTKPLEIQLMIEDSEDRLTEEEVDKLLLIIATYIGDQET